MCFIILKISLQKFYPKIQIQLYLNILRILEQFVIPKEYNYFNSIHSHTSSDLNLIYIPFLETLRRVSSSIEKEISSKKRIIASKNIFPKKKEKKKKTPRQRIAESKW